MVRALKLLAFASVGFLPATVIAQESLPVQTVQDAFHACETVVSADFDGGIEEAFNTGICLGVARAVNSVLDFNCWSIAEGSTPLRAATPISPAATIQAFLNWAEDNPQMWDTQFTTALLFVTSDAFPCEDGSG